ncbi:MAG: preprotein translocase subunit SecG [Bacteroidales bacterium]|nr:preprotein translocase subunit SecG [Bacteroidales bacterium]
MYNIIVILIIVICVLLALVVLVQNSKGGGLAANFSAPTQVMGVRQTTDFLEKTTWWLAGILVALSLFATISISRGTSSSDPLKSEAQVSNYSPVQQAPAAPAAMPVAAEQAAAADQQ